MYLCLYLPFCPNTLVIKDTACMKRQVMVVVEYSEMVSVSNSVFFQI